MASVLVALVEVHPARAASHAERCGGPIGGRAAYVPDRDQVTVKGRHHQLPHWAVAELVTERRDGRRLANALRWFGGGGAAAAATAATAATAASLGLAARRRRYRRRRRRWRRRQSAVCFHARTRRLEHANRSQRIDETVDSIRRRAYRVPGGGGDRPLTPSRRPVLERRFEVVEGHGGARGAKHLPTTRCRQTNRAVAELGHRERDA